MIKMGLLEPLPFRRATRLARVDSRREELHRNALALERGLDHFRDARFIARRVARIDFQQGGEVFENLRLEFAPIDRIALLRADDRRRTAPPEGPHSRTPS